MICQVIEPLNLSEAEWRRRLTPAQYRVLRQGGTEPPFSGVLTEWRGIGSYHCAACQLEVFGSADRYDSGTGWPSFSRPIAPDRVTDHSDLSLEGTRTEVRCARCDGHLGHLCADGPPPDGLRWCINAIALEFRARR